MPLQQTSGNVTADAYGGGVAAVPQYIEDVFNVWLYTGNGSSQNINNGIDLSTYGGLVWVKARSAAQDNALFDTIRGPSDFLFSNRTDAETNYSPYGVSAFNADGFSVAGGGGYLVNGSGTTYASWTFRKQPKFFDIVTYTGNGSGTGVAISHALGSVPGVVIVKCTSDVLDWRVLETSTQSTLNLNATTASPAFSKVNKFGNYSSYIAPTSTTVYVNDDINTAGRTYVMYLFAHNAGGFGLTGTDNVISCGSYTGNGSVNGPSINLGYEPQFVIIKHASGSNNWEMYDNMRGVATGGNDALLRPNTAGPEENTDNILSFTATGFQLTNIYSNTNGSGQDYIYIAIRRGPMKVPTDATSVFGITTAAGTSPAYVSSFPVDVALRKQITGGDPTLQARLTGATKMFTDYTFEEGNDANVTWAYQNGMFTTTGANANQYGWLMKRAPSFMDVVCYTGTGSVQNITHNLTVKPQLIIFKKRSSATAGYWFVYAEPLGATKNLTLDSTDAESVYTPTFNDTEPTSTVFTVGAYSGTNGSGATFISYLFATAAGVSKVGSYTGNGTTQTINCGFTGGARFVIIKRTDSTGGWYVYDTNRGMTTLTDPYFFLNDAAAQVATLGSVTTVSTGFALNSTILAAINVSGGSYIFFAVA